MSGQQVDRIRRNNRIDQLSPEDRAVTAHDLAVKWAEGWTFTALSKEYNITTQGVKTLLQEHAAYVRNARPDTRSLQEEEYRRFYGQMKGIDPKDTNVSALVRAKAVEARIQILTRLDKLLGHEIQGDIDGAVNSVSELVRKMNQRGDFRGVSPADLARIGEEEDIIDAEIIEDYDGREDETEVSETTERREEEGTERPAED